MALSTQRVVSDGTLVQLPLSILYFDRTEIQVFFAGVLTDISTGLWSWVGTTDTKINFTPAVTNGVEILVKRSTAMALPRHQYTLGAQFVASTLDDNFNQMLRVAQEAKEGSTLSEIFNDLDVHGFKIKNLATATLSGDAVSLGQYQADASGASASKVAAQASQSAAATSATNAATSEANALTYKNAASTSATNASTSEANALTYKNAANTSAGAANTSAGAASTSQSGAATSATNAATSATNAATSAASVVRDGSGGVAGLTGFAINLWNAAKTFKSLLTFSGTANRTHTFQDRDGTIADYGAGTFTGDVTVPSLNGGSLGGMRNFIINGGCRVAQRGGVAAVNNTWTYGGCDRIPFGPTAFTTLSGTVQQYPGAAGYQSSAAQGASITTTGTGSVTFQTRLESVDVRRLNGKTVTFSVYAYQTTGGTVNAAASIGKANTLDTFSGQTTLATGTSTPVPNNTVTKLSVTVTLGASDASNGLWCQGSFPVVGAVTTKDFLFGDWQLEVGSVDTPLEPRSYASELAMSQRYYWLWHALNTTMSCTTTGFGLTIPFPTQMRSGVTPGITTNITDANFTSSGGPTGTQWGIQVPGVSASTKTGTFTFAFSATDQAVNCNGYGATIGTPGVTFVPSGTILNVTAEL